MEKSNIPTAKEILKQYSDKANRIQEVRFEEMLQEFAKLHVEAALEAVHKNGKLIDDKECFKNCSCKHPCKILDKESILNAYPLTNIE